MKLTVTISDDNAAILSRWASLGRTFDAAIRALNAMDDTSDIGDIAIDELTTLKPLLDPLFMDLRSCMWGEMRREPVGTAKCPSCGKMADYAKDDDGINRFLIHLKTESDTCRNTWRRIPK